MTGTWVNVAAIIGGSLLGRLLGRGIPERVSNAMIKVLGIGVVLLGLNGVLAAMMSVNPDTGKLVDSGGLLLIVSLALGCLTGELLGIDDALGRFGRFMERRLGAAGFARGFVTASLIFPIGAMSIIGALNDGLRGDSQVLLAKSLIDCVTSVLLASSLGIGVLFSFVSVLLVQGGVALLAGIIAPFITDSFLAQFCMVGYAVVIAIGLNFVADCGVKVANLLPALAVPVVYAFIVEPYLLPVFFEWFAR